LGLKKQNGPPPAATAAAERAERAQLRLGIIGRVQPPVLRARGKNQCPTLRRPADSYLSGRNTDNAAGKARNSQKDQRLPCQRSVDGGAAPRGPPARASMRGAR